MRYNTYSSMPTASITVEGSSYVFTSPFNRALVDALKKEILSSERKWDNGRKVWIVAPSAGQKLVEITSKYLGIDLDLPPIGANGAPNRVVKILKVEYIGQTKDRGGNEYSAFAFVDGGWNAIFMEDTLRQFFEGTTVRKPMELRTLYEVLALTQAASSDGIRAAYRRLAKQWHPDVCSEPDAAEQFKAIKNAYEVLGDDKKRRKYDAGLKLQDSLKLEDSSVFGLFPRSAKTLYNGYRPPYRCGWVMIEGEDTLGRIKVYQIHSWEDIVNEQGQTMNVSWPAGADKFEVRWV